MNENNYYLKKSKAVLREVRKSVIGKDDVICKVYMAIIAGGHVLLDDIPGVGKTTWHMHLQMHSDLSTTEYSLHQMLCHRI